MKSELAAEDIDVGKHCFSGLVARCCADLGIAEPVINWAVEYDRSTTRYVAFVFFRFENKRFQLHATELASLSTNEGLKETITQKIMEALENASASTP